MTNLFLLLLCFINVALYIVDPHVQIIVVFLCSQRAADFNPRAISLFNPSLIHFGSDLQRALYSGADAVCQ